MVSYLLIYWDNPVTKYAKYVGTYESTTEVGENHIKTITK